MFHSDTVQAVFMDNSSYGRLEKITFLKLAQNFVLTRSHQQPAPITATFTAGAVNVLLKDRLLLNYSY